MMQYSASNPDYKTFGLLVHHTDAARIRLRQPSTGQR